MNYLIYKITNKVNSKIYIGCHKTSNVNDSYMGSGKLIKQAIKKYGLKNFTKEILYTFDNPEDMFAMELELVNKEFINDRITYNLKEGGIGGFSYINNDPNIKEKQRNAIKEAFDNMTQDERNEKFGHVGEANHNYGKSLSKETKQKLSEANTGRKHSAAANKKKSRPGPLNGMYGKKHSVSTLEKLKSPKSEDHKQKISESKLGIKHKIVTCPHCNKSGGIVNMKRYHLDNCKFKE